MATRKWVADMKACEDMADVCELAHERTIVDCKKKGITVDCQRVADCGDDGHEHGDPEERHYTAKSQAIFDGHYDEITEVSGV